MRLGATQIGAKGESLPGNGFRTGLPQGYLRNLALPPITLNEQPTTNRPKRVTSRRVMNFEIFRVLFPVLERLRCPSSSSTLTRRQ